MVAAAAHLEHGTEGLAVGVMVGDVLGEALVGLAVGVMVGEALGAKVVTWPQIKPSPLLGSCHEYELIGTLHLALLPFLLPV